jgi:ubiquinone/menaquinone biosynthesis C-methylase UbiE
MSSKFHAKSADSYEQLMGRWSRRLARPFLDFAGLEPGERVLDVGCGTGSLTFTIPEVADVLSIDGIDFSETYVDAARERNADPRITIARGDVCELPFPDDSFDRTLALLMLHFVPESERALAEMTRVTKPGGIVAAAVWDSFGGMPIQRMFWDTAAILDPAAAKIRGETYFKPLTRRGEMGALWRKTGLDRVTEAAITIQMEFQDFEDYWRPIAAGEGPLGQYATGLDGESRTAFERALRSAFEAGLPDGPRSFAATAWVCRGIVPR